jgi:phosphohistidine phosphatase
VRQVWLLRHAKSAWDDPGLADEDRPLAPRGRRAAAAMADHLATLETPRLVLCSSGLRARQTLALVLPSLGAPLDVRVEPELYTFDAGAVLARLRRLDDVAPSVLLVGHNPAFEDAARRLSADCDLRRRMERKFPTAALATIELPDGPWSAIADGAGTLVRFVTPKDLSSD